VSVLLGIVSYLEKAPEIHEVKTSCGTRYQEQTDPARPDKRLPLNRRYTESQRCTTPCSPYQPVHGPLVAPQTQSRDQPVHVPMVAPQTESKDQLVHGPMAAPQDRK
jgi:hypothetical protein